MANSSWYSWTRWARSDSASSAFERACSEGKAYFGDPRVYAERLLDKPRHIEVQVVADRYGSAVHVGERECSIQRRHQKVVEECPSPVVGPELRGRLGEAALAIVAASGYYSVGTVEFLVDAEGDFFFLEMNTRLQVEHPVTEEVYGVDLVREQINLALGAPLSFRQEELVPRGHAIECRLYAEDPLRGFAPSPGKITLLIRPAGPGVRVDSGVLAESVVPLEYDPMLAKLIVWAHDRTAAVERLRRALSEYQVRGIATTLGLFRALVPVASWRTHSPKRPTAPGGERAPVSFTRGFRDEVGGARRGRIAGSERRRQRRLFRGRSRWSPPGGRTGAVRRGGGLAAVS
ncbi:MAG: hypothetical protein P8Y93_07730 [Acidobacteriota bacterium]